MSSTIRSDEKNVKRFHRQTGYFRRAFSLPSGAEKRKTARMGGFSRKILPRREERGSGRGGARSKKLSDAFSVQGRGQQPDQKDCRTAAQDL